MSIVRCTAERMTLTSRSYAAQSPRDNWKRKGGGAVEHVWRLVVKRFVAAAAAVTGSLSEPLSVSIAVWTGGEAFVTHIGATPAASPALRLVAPGDHEA